MANWSLPTIGSDYLDVLDLLHGKDVNAGTLFSDSLAAATNIPTGAIRYNRALDKFQEWDGAAWVDQGISIAGGGTGSTTAAGARTNLGLGTMATQAASGVAITGGTISGVTISGLNATTAFSSGTVPTARLGSGVADATKFLRGDQSWQVITISSVTWTLLPKIAAYTVTVGDVNGKTIVLCDGTFQLDLPAANNGGITVPVQGLRVVNIGTGVITIVPASGTIIGAASFEFDFGQWSSLEIVPRASDNNWMIF